MDLKETISERIKDLDAKIAARDGRYGYRANVEALRAARSELQRILDSAQ